MTDETFEVDTPEPPSATAPVHPSRRALLRGAALAGVAVPFLAACASSSNAGSGASGAGTTDSSGATGGGSAAGGSGGGGAAVLTTTSQVPDGGGLILDQDGIVITQPAAGTFKGFSNICTHQQCPVSNVSNGTINCLCHGSQYSIEDGSVVGGPAPAPLPPKNVAVKGKNITLA